jgi:hypothetical protein
MDDPIQSRGQAIENVFFARADQELLAKLKKDMDASESRDALASASGIQDTEVLDALLKNNISPETLTTIGLIPLIAVGWADHVMEEAEKNAILQAADVAGIKMGTSSHVMLEKWLAHEPEKELLEGWVAYIGALKDVLDPAPFSQLKTNIIQRAESVAKSAGGFLGLGNKVSDTEQQVLEQLAKAFD